MFYVLQEINKAHISVEAACKTKKYDMIQDSRFKIQDCLLLYICLQAYTYKAHCDIMKIISIMQS